MAMTPQEYGNRYLKMSYTYNGDRYDAPIDRYLAMSAAICSPNKLLRSAVAKTFLHDGITEAEKKGTITRQGHGHHGVLKATAPDGEVRTIAQSGLRQAFYGKGTPSDYEDVLWLATHVGQITNDSGKVSDDCCLAKDYAYLYLGIDCSGFAMNYLGVSRLIKDLDMVAP